MDIGLGKGAMALGLAAAIDITILNHRKASTMRSGKLFFITGISSGLGRAIALAAAQAGHRVVGTIRNPADAATFSQEERVETVELDITDHPSIALVVDETERRHGPVDVLVNNAGYGHEGVLEESSLDEARRQFEVNVFGTLAVSHAFLPRFRQRRAGFILNVSSMGGLITMPGIAYYCGSKFALQGISEVMRAEMAPFGVHVTALCPGSFRTDWAGRSMRRTERCISDYDKQFDPLRAARRDKSGKQRGDPAKLAQAVLRLIETDNPPPQLLLGSDALRLVRDRLQRMQHEIDAWESVTQSTDG